MNKMSFKILMLVLVTFSFAAYAELPSPSNQPQYNPGYNTQYNGYNNGSNQFNYPPQYGSGAYGYGATSMQQQQQMQQMQQQNSSQKMQRAYNTYTTGKDLLWVFTGDEGSFGKRLFYMFSGVLDRKFLQPVENSIGSFGQPRQVGTTPVAQVPYNQGQQYCYECMKQNSTNPYAQNQNAINPAIFGGNTNQPSGNRAAGGIQH